MERLRRSNARKMQALREIFLQLEDSPAGPANFFHEKRRPDWGRRCIYIANQAARLLSKVDFKGSAAFTTTFWASVASSVSCEEMTSNCLRAWSV